MRTIDALQRTERPCLTLSLPALRMACLLCLPSCKELRRRRDGLPCSLIAARRPLSVCLRAFLCCLRCSPAGTWKTNWRRASAALPQMRKPPPKPRYNPKRQARCPLRHLLPEIACNRWRLLLRLCRHRFLPRATASPRTPDRNTVLPAVRAMRTVLEAVWGAREVNSK